MTKKALIDKVINIAESFLGCNEYDGSHKIIIDTYNMGKLPRGYKLKYSDSWCACYISVVFYLAGLQELVGKECGCEEFIKIFKEKGIWTEDGTVAPKRGDIILYNWDNKMQPNNGHSDHIGLVTEVNDATRVIKVIEGNINNKVGYRNVSYGAGFIRGYARPKYEKYIEPKPDYENLGWNKDEKGWWYAFGHNKGDYHKNNAVRIENELFFFDVDGYCVKNPSIETDDRGVMKYIHGDRVI